MADINVQIQDAIDNNSAIGQFSTGATPYHTHSGLDAPNVSFQDLVNRNEVLHIVMQGSIPATATNYGVFFIAPYPCLFVNAMEVHSTAGGANAAVDIEKLTGTQSQNGGVSMLTSAFLLSSTANTVQYRSRANIQNSNFNLATGDRLGFRTGGTLAGTANVCIMVKISY